MSPIRDSWRYTLPVALLLMAPFDILASLAMDIYLPVVPAMPSELDATPIVIQLTLSIYIAVLGVGQLIFGPISDRIGRRPVILCGGFLFTSASFGLASSSSVVFFVLLRSAQALGASAVLVATFATVRDVYANRQESVTIYGLFSSILAFVPALGPIAGAMIANEFGWRAIFVTLGTVSLLATVNALLWWNETRPVNASLVRRRFRPVLESPAFWTYTLGFSAAMGTFFLFFSTAPSVLIERADYSELQFSLAFSTVAIVMIITTRFTRRLIERMGIARSLSSGMVALILGAALLCVGEFLEWPSFATFVLPMWVMAIGIVFAVSVTANGALAGLEDVAGSAVALYFCTQSLIVTLLGTVVLVALRSDTAWPIVVYSLLMAAAVLTALRMLRRYDRVQQ
ncbi:DHA1 family florfenicol/chloramphenicol resistance protein-like MFS transporter [Neorhizobium sp. R1-B]|uniref:CmlA/FloR family chloramphenicol efflux MFS transporter n=1 Tax=Neorhizobium sp. R1-B TaxID=2485162 RepID=UPI0010662A69|nr:CmlA/FloR family chloramphenicol efflux MFS transporter [Neorhizobium sp. R1-B]TDX79683.1 DHA1 family florfenicol/chloramphenicol resistance protein-like MFS transporter [Neorhizobium sp. R1-B]